MTKVHLILSILITAAIAFYVLFTFKEEVKDEKIFKEEIAKDEILLDDTIYLPMPKKYSNMSVEEAILLRRSVREYEDKPVDLEHLSLMLWAAYGITDPRFGFRACPSAGATYPLEVYVVVGEKGVETSGKTYLKPGVYKYDVHRHLIFFVKEGDFRAELAEAAVGQEWVKNAPINIVVTAIFERTTIRYGDRGEIRYVPMEVGHLGQNVYLIATALGYGTVVVGAFYDDRVRDIVGAEKIEVPMYIIPVGVPKKPHKISFEEVWNYIESKRRIS
ncbi:MAG: SagB/ThcOx family dehydrogenase [Archaeoglobaceae archaeon]|nr:SagB/ThcOx family dehydrogenase [Archaeoglobaceae archaeon]